MKRLVLFIFLIILNINVYAIDDATLKNIKVNGKECECVPVVGAFECIMEVDSSNATITYEKSEEATTNRDSGVSTPLTTGENNISITVKTSDNIINIYNFIITKHIKSSDYSLSKLVVNNKEIGLLDSVYVYAMEVLFNDEEIVVVPTLNDEKASVVTSNLTYEFPISESSRSIDFEVKAENGDKKNYRIVLTRSARPITTLNSLKIDKGYLNFKQDIFEYKVSVDYAVTELIVEAIPNDEKASVKINKDKLEVGENNITIEVNNQGAIDTYTIKVIREPNMDKSLANLKTLKIKEVSNFRFDPNILEYDLNLKSIPSKLTINANSKSNDGLIEITGNEDLADGSFVKIKVSLKEMNIERVYILKLLQVKESEISKVVIIIVMVILVITMVILFILQFKGKKRKKRIRRKVVKEEIEII